MTTIVKDYTPEYFRAAKTEIEKAVAITAVRIQREAKRLTSQHSGPPGSIPPAPPHVRTGRLTGDIAHETFERRNVFFARIGTPSASASAKYAEKMELGYGFAPWEQPRPYMRPALDSQRDFFTKAVIKAGKKMNRPRRP